MVIKISMIDTYKEKNQAMDKRLIPQLLLCPFPVSRAWPLKWDEPSEVESNPIFPEMKEFPLKGGKSS